MEDREPAIRAKLDSVLAATRDGRLSPNDFAYVRAGFFPNAAKAYQQALAGFGTPDRVTLMQRTTLGDDRISVYDLASGARVIRVTLGLAPDGKVSAFAVRRR
jgi:hypothetical protein